MSALGGFEPTGVDTPGSGVLALGGFGPTEEEDSSAKDLLKRFAKVVIQTPIRVC